MKSMVALVTTVGLIAGGYSDAGAAKPLSECYADWKAGERKCNSDYPGTDAVSLFSWGLCMLPVDGSYFSCALGSLFLQGQGSSELPRDLPLRYIYVTDPADLRGPVPLVPLLHHNGRGVVGAFKFHSGNAVRLSVRFLEVLPADASVVFAGLSLRELPDQLNAHDGDVSQLAWHEIGKAQFDPAAQTAEYIWHTPVAPVPDSYLISIRLLVPSRGVDAVLTYAVGRPVVSSGETPTERLSWGALKVRHR